jgi:hypothetical protein
MTGSSPLPTGGQAQTMKIEFTMRRLCVIPAKAGIQNKKLNAWIPSFEGMTMDGKFLTILFST